jgi:hypothetical protein
MPEQRRERRPPPEANAFYRSPEADGVWKQGDIFTFPSTYVADLIEHVVTDPDDGEETAHLLSRVVNDGSFAEGGSGLSMLLSHTCDYAEKGAVRFRTPAVEANPLLMAPILPLDLLPPDQQGLAWNYGWYAGQFAHIFVLPPLPGLIPVRAMVHLRLIGSVQADLLKPPLVRLVALQRRRLRQQLARFFSRLDPDLEAMRLHEEAGPDGAGEGVP